MEESPVINFSTSVPPGSSESITHIFDDSGYITHFHARAYPGEEMALERQVYLHRDGIDGGNAVPVIRSPEGSNEYLSGDSQTWDFDMRREFDKHDALEVKYVNTGDFEYNASTVITVDHDTNFLEQLGGLL